MSAEHRIIVGSEGAAASKESKSVKRDLFFEVTKPITQSERKE